MDKNKNRSTLTVRDIRPVVRMANYREVDRGASWGERTIPDIELVLVVAGRFAYETRTEAPLLLEEGDVLLIPPDEWHTLRRLDPPARAAFSCIHAELLPDVRWAQGSYVFHPTPQRSTPTGGDAAIHDLFLRCAETYEGYETFREELLEVLLKELWIRLAGYWRGGGGNQISERIRPMVSYLRSHMAEPVGRRDLAKAFRITPEHVNALFRRELGVTPTQFLHRERVMRAYRLLRDQGLCVKEAAAQVGFDDPFYFSRVFREVLKRTPSSVRGQRTPD